jgi:signal transduction histidine kinase
MSSSRKARVAFALALFLLFLSGLAAGSLIIRLYSSEALIRHTYDVEVALGDLETSLTSMGRNRVAYISSGSSESLRDFTDAEKEVGVVVARIRQLTSDNPAQQKLCDQLAANANERIAVAQASVDLRTQNRSDPGKQFELTAAVARTTFGTAAIAQQMRGNEDALLQERSRLSQLLFTALPGILAVSFALSAAMFWLHYYMLNRELQERRGAENQLRRLSMQLMRVQDEERRRFARELHDELGQNLVGAHMMAEALSASDGKPQIAELSTLLADLLSRVRTLSYLFHPPLLEDAGFYSAANWLIEGFASRVGIAISANIPNQPERRLDRAVELTLYRVLQESLNNIYRHSKSSRAEVSVEAGVDRIILRVRDFGRGIPTEKLEALRTNAEQNGIGLTGMKERVREQGGELEIRSDGGGTEIIVTLQIAQPAEALGAGIR